MVSLNSPDLMMSCPSPPLPPSSFSPFLFRRLAIPFLFEVLCAAAFLRYPPLSLCSHSFSLFFASSCSLSLELAKLLLQSSLFPHPLLVTVYFPGLLHFKFSPAVGEWQISGTAHSAAKLRDTILSSPRSELIHQSSSLYRKIQLSRIHNA